jgi:hypothetical protein
MPPKRTLTQEEKNAKAQKQRDQRQNESPAVREKRLAQQREYDRDKYNREKRRRLNPVEPDGRAAQADFVPPVQEGEPNEDEADQQQDMDGLGAPLEEPMETDQQQDMDEPGVPLEEATEDLNDEDIQPHAEIVPVETETEREYREEFLRELRQQTRQTRIARTHRLDQREVLREDSIPTHDCGRMDWKCGYCHALHFKKEMSSNKKFSNCCNKGKVSLPDLKECPEFLKSLLTNSHPQATNFMRKIRNYNCALVCAAW